MPVETNYNRADDYDQINDYLAVDFDAKETILISGIQYDFKEDIYFTM